jgi:ribonuclease P protein component
MVSVCGCGPAPAAPSSRPGAARAAPACPADRGPSTTVLPRLLRMRSSKDFQQTTRRGVRASRPTLVVHAAHLLDGCAPHRNDFGRSGPRIGFVVNGSVGNAVSRNRVRRRLRHLAAAHVADAPAGIGPGRIGIVVRARPRAATDPAEVPTDFGSAWHEAVSRLAKRQADVAGPNRDGGAR